MQLVPFVVSLSMVGYLHRKSASAGTSVIDAALLGRDKRDIPYHTRLRHGRAAASQRRIPLGPKMES